MPAADFPREALVEFASQALEAWDARQHLSPNHGVVFDETDPDRAVCYSYMYAQHHAKGEPVYLMRGSYDHHLVRTGDGWKISRVVQHISWTEGDPNAFAK
ncbi:nuclear transport factor 2 family protein [Cryptosporangium japonicum]|uniref:SnoaL-like domain-containing protein n=1 Tax=Cryptosporangium japonicum TaxID=80872 RepID=A0ABP3DU67_9ACTN